MKLSQRILHGLHFFIVIALALPINALTYYVTMEFFLDFMEWYTRQSPSLKLTIITLTGISLSGVVVIVS